ncbi:MAG: hypothetical protein V2A69_11035 [Pseudomonadota bacterium]
MSAKIKIHGTSIRPREAIVQAIEVAEAILHNLTGYSSPQVL